MVDENNVCNMEEFSRKNNINRIIFRIRTHFPSTLQFDADVIVVAVVRIPSFSTMRVVPDFLFVLRKTPLPSSALAFQTTTHV